MSSSLRLILATLLGGVVAGVVGFGLYWQFVGSHQGQAVAEEALPHDIQMNGLDGRPRNLDHWRGKLLLINFWATWCTPCRHEMPLLEQAQKTYGSRGLQIVGPAVDDPKAVRAALPKLGINYPVLTGSPDQMLAVMDRLGNSPGGLPFSVLVSPAGMIIQRHLGELDAGSLDAMIRAHLPH